MISKNPLFFFFINLSHLCIRRFIHFSYASIYLCIVYTLLLLVVHWRLHSPQLQTILHRFNSPHSLNLHIPSYLPANNVTTVRSTIVSYTNDTRVYRLSITIALFTIVERITGARSIETFQRSCNIREKRRKRDRKRWKTSFFPSISSRIPSFSLVLLPSFHSFSRSERLTNARFSSLFCFERTIIRSLEFLFGRNHVTKDCTKRRRMARWPSRKIRANASLQGMKKRLPNASWTLVSRFSILFWSRSRER